MVGKRKVSNMSEEHKTRILSFLDKRGFVYLKDIESPLKCAICFSGQSKLPVKAVSNRADESLCGNRFIVWVDSRSCDFCYMNTRPIPLYNIKLPEKLERERTLKLFMHIGCRYG